MRFCGHVPHSPRNKNMKKLISYLLEKVVVLDPKRLLSPFRSCKKNFFFSTLNVMISQLVRNESVRFGRHTDIEVSYKILQLEIPKLVQILHYLACFQKGLFAGNFEQNTLRPLGFKNLIKNGHCGNQPKLLVAFCKDFGLLGINEYH
jgi:hypothetical protein